MTKGVLMKQFLKSALCTALLLSPCVARGDFSGGSGGSNSSNSGSSEGPFIPITPVTPVNQCFTSSNSGCSFNNCNTCQSSFSNSCSESCSESCGSFSSNSDCFSGCGLGYVNYRSQGANTARQLVGWQTEIDRFGVGQFYGVSTFTFEYQRSFRSRRIARDLFGTDTLNFAGSLVPNRAADALIADQFGVATNFVGSIRLHPRIENFIFEWDGYFASDDCDCWNGAWFEFHLPVVHSRWRLGLSSCESQVTSTVDFPICSLSATSVVTPATLIDGLTGNFTLNGQRFLCSGIFPACHRKKTGLADLELWFGYNFINNECSAFGLFLALVLPTGNKPNSDHIFQPIIGNGRHFELGVGFRGHTLLWDDGCDQNLYLYGQGLVTHMFKNRQCRLLDFCNNGPFSRYLLLREFQADGITPTGNIVSATCFNRRDVDVRIDVKGDASFKLAYRWCGWGVDLGYNIYGHSREKVRFRDNCSPCNADIRRLGIAGTNGVCCNTYPVVPSRTTGCNAISGPSTGTNLINATFSQSATAFSPTTASGADRAVPAPHLGAHSVCLQADQNPASSQIPAIGTLVPTSGGTCTATTPLLAPQSSRPSLVSANDLDPRSAEACSVLTNKVFGYVGYYWADECGWNPFLGVGAEGEFRGSNGNHAGLNQWGVLVKGGISF